MRIRLLIQWSIERILDFCKFLNDDGKISPSCANSVFFSDVFTSNSAPTDAGNIGYFTGIRKVSTVNPACATCKIEATQIPNILAAITKHRRFLPPNVKPHKFGEYAGFVVFYLLLTQSFW